MFDPWKHDCIIKLQTESTSICCCIIICYSPRAEGTQAQQPVTERVKIPPSIPARDSRTRRLASCSPNIFSSSLTLAPFLSHLTLSCGMRLDDLKV